MLSHGDDEVFRPRTGKWALLLVLAVAFVAGGYLMAISPRSASEKLVGYACIGFFGLGGMIAVAHLVPGSSFLRVGPDGLTVRTLWRTTFYRWSDIEGFGVAELGTLWRRHELVGSDFSESYPGRDEARALKDINRELSGFEASLPDSYGWDFAALAEHLNRLREKYLTPPDTTGTA